jgi:predicted nucleotidyltransferase
MNAAQPVVPPPIRALLDQILEAYHPLQIWLFGSRARGTHRPDSDWDLLAVVDDGTPDDALTPWSVWRTLGLERVAADVVLVPRSEFEEDRDTPNTLVWPVSREGMLLYER